MITIDLSVVTNVPLWCRMLITGEPMLTWRQNVFGKSLYLLISFAVNQQLLWKKKKKLFLKKIKVVHDFVLTNNCLPWTDLFKIRFYKVISFSTLLKIKSNKEKKINIERLAIFYFLHTTLSKSCFYKKPTCANFLWKYSLQIIVQIPWNLCDLLPRISRTSLLSFLSKTNKF